MLYAMADFICTDCSTREASENYETVPSGILSRYIPLIYHNALSISPQLRFDIYR